MTDNGNLETDPRSLSHRIQESKGQEIVNQLDRLAGSRYIVEKNHEQLHAAVDAYDNIDGSWFLHDPDGARDIHHEFLRCLHNYLASLYTLFEHAKTFQGRLDDKSIEEQLKKKVAELEIPARGDFLKGLRNDFQHRELLHVNLKERFDNNLDTGGQTVERSLILDREKLLEFTGWTSRARTFVDQMDDQVDLLEELDTYQQDITALYEWIEDRVRDRYAAELQERDELIRQVREHRDA